MSAEPKRVEELASLLSDHSFHTGYAAEQWFSCGCGWRSKAIHRFTAHAQHFLHIADAVRAAGWVSPEEATAREAAARREALLEAAEWLRESAAALAEPERDEEDGR